MTRSTIAHASRRPPGVVAVALAAVLVGACNSSPSPSPTPSNAPSAAASASATPASLAPSASAAACAATDVRATGGPWGGAAGSRGSDIVVASVAAAACLLPARPTVAVIDAIGQVLVSTQAQAGPGPSLAPGGSSGFSVVLGNWCAQGTNLPLHFQLALAGDSVDIANLAVTSADELPPCNGPGQPVSLSTTDWQP